MRQFAQTVFGIVQTGPANEYIDPASYLPKRNNVTDAVREINEEYRQKFIITVRRVCLSRWSSFES